MHPNEATLNEYADGSLGATERAGVEQHLAACAPCRQLVDDLRDILRATGDLEPLDAPVRAWPRLERAIRMEREHATRLTDEPQSSNAVTAPAEAGSSRKYATWLAAAAALVLAAVVGMRYTPARPADVPATAPAGATASVAAGGAAESIETELRQAEAHYENAIKGLEAIATTEQSELDPRTAATLQKNLAVIDQAISESRAAVRSEPASEPAQQSLIEGFKTKIGLLQDTVALINEMRKGNEAGAARIVSGLKQKGN
jgi:anti-sigma factor ChrR (cupin superfamily)